MASVYAALMAIGFIDNRARANRLRQRVIA